MRVSNGTTGARGLLRGLGLAAGLAGAMLVSPAYATSTGTRTSGFAYDSATGLLTQEVVEPSTSSLTVTTDYTYDAYGNKLTATTSGVDITIRTSTNTYDTKGQFATTIANALGQSESWTYDPKFGVPLSHTGPNGLTTTWTYDSFGRKTHETRADGTQTAMAYAYCSGVNGGSATCPTYGAYVVTVTPLASDGVTQNGPVSQTYYDQMGRVIASDTESFDGSITRTATQYDAYGRVAQASKPYFLTSGTPKWIVNTYDAIGRVLTTTLPDSSVTSIAYHGLSTTTTNAKSQVKTELKNARGLIVSVTDNLGKTITYAYDAFDNLVSTTDSAGNVSTATYDVAGHKTAMNDPDMGAWTYTYDVLGELKTQTDAKSQVTTISYDKLGRVTQRVEPGLTSNWTYDTASMGIGKLASVTTDHGYTRVEYYDALGRPSQTSVTILGDTSSSTTSYDANGQVSHIAYPSGFAVDYSYNTRGYLTQVKDANSTQVFWTPNTYDGEGHLIQATAGNGVVTTQTFDANTGFKTGIQAGVSNAVADFTYTYDALSNLTGRTDANQSLTETFTYDGMNRITQYAITGGATKTVTYDDLGNITSKSDVGTYVYPIAGATGPHAVSSITPSGSGTVNTTFTYDANGNMTAGNGRTTTWTSFNKVASITRGTTTVSFDYDADHARMRQVTPTQTTLYMFGIEKVTGTSGAIQWNEYIRVGGMLIGEHYTNIAAGGGGTTTSMRYFVTDHLGSVAVITDETGAVVERLSYDAWGKRRYPSGADDPTGSITSQTTKGFTGHEMIDDVGLVNMNGRVYDPQLGRFMSADPYVQDPTNSQALNRYSYVNNNPLSYTDPTGYFSLGSLIKTIIAVVITVVAIIYGQAWVAGALYGSGTAAAAACTTVCGAIAGAVGGAISAGITSGGDMRSILVGAVGGAAFGALGASGVVQNADLGIRTIAYGVTGGVTSVLGGGNFQSGFLAAGFGTLAGAAIRDVAKGDVVFGTVASGVAGGAGSVLGGGKFENGAVTGAFAYAVAAAITPAANDNEQRSSNKCQMAAVGGAVCSPDDPKGLGSTGDLTQNRAPANLVSSTNSSGTVDTLARNGDVFEIRAQGSSPFSDAENGHGMVSMYGSGTVRVDAWTIPGDYVQGNSPDLTLMQRDYAISTVPVWGRTYIKIEGILRRSIIRFSFIETNTTLPDTKVELYRH